MKKITFLAVLCVLKISAQNGGYFREWATFIGPSYRVNVLDFKNNKLLSRSSIFPNYSTQPLNLPYYNQFISPGFSGIPNSTESFFNQTYSASGVISNAYYSSNLQVSDNAGNIYTCDSVSDSTTLPYNTWMPNNPYPPSNTVVLAKYDASNNLLWKTYLPTTTLKFINFGEDGSIYVSAATTKPDIATASTWKTDFVTAYSGGQIIPNNFLAKLTSGGQLLWCTYLPVMDVDAIDVKDNTVAIASFSDFLSTDTNLATPGAFCTQKRGSAITILNATNGIRSWGTYYGDPDTFSFLGEITITPYSILVMGDEINGNGYFATEGALKSVPHNEDFFISKFSLDGTERNWSTYMGTNGDEFYTSLTSSLPNTSHQMSYKNGRILFLGDSENATNNISTAGAYQTTPSNIYITMLDETKGDQIFTTYYGPQTTGTLQLARSWCTFSSTENSFYISGSSTLSNNITTTGSTHPSILPIPNTNGDPQPPAGFIAKFSYDPTMLSTSEISQNAELVLYDNPNHGHFTIKGDILAKESCTVSVYDATGKMILNQKLAKTAKAEVSLPAGTPTGNYVVSVATRDKLVKSFKMVKK